MRWIWIFLVVLLAGISSDAVAEKRVALIIGNSAYQHAPQLTNPDNDASDMASKLTGLGFEVFTGRDLDLTEMRRSIRDFVGKLEGADMALFFYAGHGVQVSGDNYLIPIDARLTSYNDLDFEALPIELVLSAMERNASVNLVFLDACRDNPLAETLARSMGTRSAAVGRGLAKLGTGLGSLIAFATQPGNVALDGIGRNSPFTTALLKHLGTPGQSITDDLIAVRRAVLEATDGKQVPWDSSSLTGPVILNPDAQESGNSGLLDTVPPSDRSVELAYWDSIKDAKSKSYFETYIKRFPDGLFTDIAKLKIEEVDAATQAAKATRPQASSDSAGGELQTFLQPRGPWFEASWRPSANSAAQE
ncbi:putative caspase-like protein [Sinorhizobium fredii]|uniref:caspase family protein n=1 Tax=Rhizobium fredii TaxID=380 RepID=UPI003517EB38